MTTKPTRDKHDPAAGRALEAPSPHDKSGLRRALMTIRAQATLALRELEHRLEWTKSDHIGYAVEIVKAARSAVEISSKLAVRGDEPTQIVFLGRRVT